MDIYRTIYPSLIITVLLDTYKHRGARQRLVKDLREKGITDEAVLSAIGNVPRHLFLSSAFEGEAYTDRALPIEQGQTISQPFTVAYQTQLLEVKPRMKVLEIGTGSGYQAAILAEMGAKVFSIEYDRKLSQKAKELLATLEYEVRLECGDGSQGWPLFQPYERILVTAASPDVPTPLMQQLEIGGKMVIPVGDRINQVMYEVIRLGKEEFETRRHMAFRFVPLRGKHGFQ